MRLGGTGENGENEGLEIVDADGGSATPVESITATTETNSRSRPLAIVLGLFVAGWMALASSWIRCLWALNPTFLL